MKAEKETKERKKEGVAKSNLAFARELPTPEDVHSPRTKRDNRRGSRREQDRNSRGGLLIAPFDGCGTRSATARPRPAAERLLRARGNLLIDLIGDDD